MNLPDFIWLWRIAAWAMGFSIVAYLLLAVTGVWIFYLRRSRRSRPAWLQPLHYTTGGIIVALVLLLLTIGIVGTLGHYGNLNHSPHFSIGLAVTGLVLLSAGSATLIGPSHSQARLFHVICNIILFLGLAAVSLTGWGVVQKYLP